MAFYLTDDGTMDTVVRCENCGQELRYNYASGPFADEDYYTDDETAYDEFIAYALYDAELEHSCSDDDEAEA